MKCELCGSNRRDSIRYGEFLTKNGKGVHTNCLYLSSGIIQNGKDEEGFLGFLPTDIAAEKKRVSNIKCCYCGEKTANIGCCEKRCTRTFHLICGIENGAMNQFIDTFRSFCHRHVRKVNYRPKKDDACCICYEKIFNESTRFSAVTMLRAPCCRNGWFHNYCLQQFAKNAGYFFKCPLCNDNQKFKRNMSLWGIFVQNKDAEWELVPNAYSELLERPNVCVAETCQNPKGRAHHANSNPFLYCVTCGSVAIHHHCASQRTHSFECDNCKSILHADSGRDRMSSQQPYVYQTDGQEADTSLDENSDVDVCGNASEEEDDCDVIKRSNFGKKYSLQKLRIVDDFDDDTFDSKSNIHTIEAVQKTDTDTYSADEGPVGIVKEKIEAFNFPECKFEIEDRNLNTLTLDAPINNTESRYNEKSDTHNVSCIAQRTRRKSVMMCLPPRIEDQEATDDDNKSTSSYKSTNCSQVFEYDGDDAHTDNIKSEDICTTEETNQTTANSLDISCIAKRTRRRTEAKGVAEHNSISKNSAYQTSGAFNEVCNDSDTGNLQLNNCEEQSSYGANCGNGLMNYFYQLLHDVKRNSQKKVKEMKNKVKDENVDEKKVKTDSTNTSCIANHTRRRINSVSAIDNIKEIYVETEDSKPAANNNSTTSSQESYASTTYFGNIIEHQNAADINLNCHKTGNASKVQRTASRKRSYDIVSENLTCDLTASIPPKIPAIDKNESKSVEVVTFDKGYCAGAHTVSAENCLQATTAMKLHAEENILEESCIAHRTRRKSMDVNHFKKLTDMAKRTERFVSVDEQALSNCQSRAITPNNKQPKGTYSNIALTLSANRRGQRRRLPTRRLLECADVYGTHKSMLGHSPIVKYANWSNVKDTTDAYITPKYVRINGKQKNVFNENTQQLQPLPAAQTHFARSYQLLLESNENHYASTSASSAQRV